MFIIDKFQGMINISTSIGTEKNRRKSSITYLITTQQYHYHYFGLRNYQNFFYKILYYLNLLQPLSIFNVVFCHRVSGFFWKYRRNTAFSFFISSSESGNKFCSVTRFWHMNSIGWSRGNRSVCIFDFSQFNFKLFSPIFYQKIQHEILYKNKLKCSFSNVPMKYGAKDMMKFQYVQLSKRFLFEKFMLFFIDLLVKTQIR